MDNQIDKYSEQFSRKELKIRVKIIGKPQCPYCVQAVELCKQKELLYEYIDANEDPKIRQEYQKQYNINTVPIIFVNDKFIGGFSEFSPYIIKVLTNQANLPVTYLEQSDKQELEQLEKIEQLTNKNINAFSIEMTGKKQKQSPLQQQENSQQSQEKEKQPQFNSFAELTQYNKEYEKKKEIFFGKRSTAEFEDGSYVHYYDNSQKFSKFKKSIPLVLICGFPAYKFEWIRLIQELGEDTCRIIVFCVPGLDDDKLTRGSYKGYVQDQALLLKNLLDFLRIPKIILGVHSFATYLQNTFEKFYPQYLLSSMLMGGVGIYPHSRTILWYDRILENMKITHEEIPENYEKVREYLDNLESQLGNMKSIQEDIPNDPYEAILFSKTMLSYRSGVDGIFKVNRQNKGILKLIAQGEEDIIVEQTLSVNLLSHYAFEQGNPNIQLTQEQKSIFLEKIKKNELLKSKLNLEYFDFDNIQQNFIFYFQKTGHSVHRRRGQELKIPIMVLIELAEVLNETQVQQQNIQPKL